MSSNTLHQYKKIQLKCNYVSLNITMHHYPSKHITTHHYTSLPITTHHYILLQITTQNNREIASLVFRERQFKPCEITRHQVFLVIRQFYISHNTPCLPPFSPPPPQILHTSLISIGTTVIPTRNKKRRLCKVLKVKGVLWEMCKWRIVLQGNFTSTSSPGLLNKRERA